MNRLQSLYDETTGNGISPAAYIPKRHLFKADSSIHGTLQDGMQ